jgi:RNA recognition motif-containing protein
VDHAQRLNTSLLLIMSSGASFSLSRVAVSEGLAQKEPPVNISVGHLACTVTAQDLRARFAPYGVVDRSTLLTDRETGRPRGCGCVAMVDDKAAQAASPGL